MRTYDEAAFFEYLVEKRGYPQGALLIHQNLPSHWRSSKFIPDAVIVDEGNRNIIAVIEIKKGDAIERGQIIERCRALSVGFGDGNVPFFLVFVDLRSPNKSHLIQLVGGTVKDVGSTDFPTYNELRGGAQVKRREDVKVEKTQTIDRFSWTCGALVLFLAVLLLLDFLGWIQWTTGRLSLLAGIIGLSVIPFAAKMKMLGVEFERKD